MILPWLTSAPPAAPGMQAVDPRAQLLAQMHDVIAPPPLSWWPPAPGWWILGISALLLIAGALWLAIHWWQSNAYRRLALAELADIRGNNTLTSQEKTQQLVYLLKRTFFSAYPLSRRRVAGISGGAWWRLLNSTTHKPVADDNLIHQVDTVLYQAVGQHDNASETVAIALENAAHKWIKTHQRRTKVIADLDQLNEGAAHV